MAYDPAASSMLRSACYSPDAPRFDRHCCRSVATRLLACRPLQPSCRVRSASEFMHNLAKVQKLMGAPLAPLESFLLARGLRTLHVRMERHGENALKVAQMLEAHPLIKQVCVL